MQTKVIFFQPPGINKAYCERGVILGSDKDYIHYIDEPCKIAISEVKIIDENNVTVQKNGLIRVK